MSIGTLPTTLLQIFGKISLISKVIIKSVIDPDDLYELKVKLVSWLAMHVFPPQLAREIREASSIKVLHYWIKGLPICKTSLSIYRELPTNPFLLH